MALAANVFVLTQRTAATPVGLATVLDGFRASPAIPSAAAPSESLDGGRAKTAPRVLRSHAPGEPPAVRPRRPGAVALPSMRPASGVYAYATSGGERVSFADARHDYPDRTFAAVRRISGCRWELEHRILEEHVERHTYCGAPGGLSLLVWRAEITFFGQRNEAAYVCDPPEALVTRGNGARGSFICRSDDGDVRETVTDLGREQIRVGDRRVDALHVRARGTVSGRARGTTRADIWIHPDSGLTLKLVREAHTTSEAFGTTVTYDEKAAFLLESLAPRT